MEIKFEPGEYEILDPFGESEAHGNKEALEIKFEPGEYEILEVSKSWGENEGAEDEYVTEVAEPSSRGQESFEKSSGSARNRAAKKISKGSRPELICKICFQTFAAPRNLRHHIEGVHMKIRGFSCDLCSKSFTRKATLQKHMVIHIGHSHRQVQCQICNKFLTSRDILRRHINDVHAKVKNFSCDLCPYKCFEKTKMRRHKANHPSKPYRKYRSRCPSKTVEKITD